MMYFIGNRAENPTLYGRVVQSTIILIALIANNKGRLMCPFVWEQT